MAEQTNRSKKTGKQHRRQKEPGNVWKRQQRKDRKNIKAINHEHEKLIQWFQTVKFRRVWIGGIDEVQLWKKLEELNGLYEAAISAERARYDTLLAEQKKNDHAMIRKYKKELSGDNNAGQCK